MVSFYVCFDAFVASCGLQRVVRRAMGFHLGYAEASNEIGKPVSLLVGEDCSAEN